MFNLLGTPWSPISAIVVALDSSDLFLGEAVHKLRYRMGALMKIIISGRGVGRQHVNMVIYSTKGSKDKGLQADNRSHPSHHNNEYFKILTTYIKSTLILYKAAQL